jgi:hypothetical protein
MNDNYAHVGDLLNDADRLCAPHVGPEGLDILWDAIDVPPYHPTHYDRSGNAISMRDWARLRAFDDLNGHRYARVARDEIGDYVVSTVWVGLDTGLPTPYAPARPLIFETMVFKDGQGDEQWRYMTETEARQGHAQRVQEVSLLQVLDAGPA